MCHWAFESRILCKNSTAIFLQCKQQNHAQYAAGNDFAQAPSNHQIPPGIGKSIAVGRSQYIRDDDGIGQNGRQRNCPFPSAKQISAHSTDQGGQTSHYDIQNTAAGQKIA